MKTNDSIESRITAKVEEICRSEGIQNVRLLLEVPRQKGFGDLSTNVAMTAAKELGVSPRTLAERIAAKYPCSDDEVSAVEIAGPGFLNFRLGDGYFYKMLAGILDNPGHLGDSIEGKDRRWLFEFVSANPTGPLNVVSARAASVGDTLVRVFCKRGFEAKSEYYFNDAGRQVFLFGSSVRARLAELEGRDGDAVIPEGGYRGEYVVDIARAWREAHSGVDSPDDQEFGKWSTEWMLEHQQAQLKRFRVTFDRWFREREVYDNGSVDKVVSKLMELGATEEKDGAVYFRASSFGDTDDRVIKTSDGRLTYRVPDIAYHVNKYERGFETSVDLLGPDHHGHIISMKAAMKALGLPEDFYKALIVQQVNLKRSGEEVKMSKRAGVMLTLDELVDEVGVDAARFFFLRRKVSTPLDFDLDLAKKHSDENPVYYIQYAHARICSILRQPGAVDIDTENAKLSLLTEEEALELLRQIALFPWTLSAIIRSIEPHPLTVYLEELARSFHLFYQRHRVISDNRELTLARLALCKGTAAVLKEGLELMGVGAPERM